MLVGVSVTFIKSSWHKVYVWEGIDPFRFDILRLIRWLVEALPFNSLYWAQTYCVCVRVLIFEVLREIWSPVLRFQSDELVWTSIFWWIGTWSKGALRYFWLSNSDWHITFYPLQMLVIYNWLDSVLLFLSMLAIFPFPMSQHLLWNSRHHHHLRLSSSLVIIPARQSKADRLRRIDSRVIKVSKG